MIHIDDSSKFLATIAHNTASLVTEAIHQFDRSGYCEINPSLDIGFPHEVMRLAAGFPTGIYVRWQCNQPFVPIDTTVNVCTSSVYLIDNISAPNLHDAFDASDFESWEALNKGGSYKLNFHKGNHFISLVQSEETKAVFLVLHSSAAEFKQTYNGISPTPANWFSHAIKHFDKDGKRIRYIVGKEAEQFYRIAKFSEPYNELRHDCFAEYLSRRVGNIAHVKHDHHYLMPDPNSVLIGSFLLHPGATVPIFTAAGDPILMAKTIKSDKALVSVGGQSKQLLPHGLGKCCRNKPILHIDYSKGECCLNGQVFPIEYSASLKNHPDLEIRRVHTPQQEKTYRHILREYCDAMIYDRLFPICSYDKHGFKRWNAQPI